MRREQVWNDAAQVGHQIERMVAKTETIDNTMRALYRLRDAALRATDPDIVTIPVDRLNQARHWASWHVSDDPDAVDFVDWVESIAPPQKQQEMEGRE